MLGQSSCLAFIFLGALDPGALTLNIKREANIFWVIGYSYFTGMVTGNWHTDLSSKREMSFKKDSPPKNECFDSHCNFLSAPEIGFGTT